MLEDKIIVKEKRALANDSIPSLFKRYAIPGVIGMLAVGIQSVVDGLIVGNFLGAEALAGVSLVLPLYSFIAAFAIIIGVGSQTLISVGMGEGDINKAQNSITTGYISIVVLCLIMSIGVLVWSKEVAYLFGASALLESHSVGYITGLFPFMILAGTTFYNDYMLRATGHPRVSMILMILAVALNILLNIFFITVLKWGTFGVGLATGLSFTVCAISIYMLQSPKAQIKLFGGKFKIKLLWDMFYNGSSEGVSELASGITIMLFNITLMKYLGEMGVAAFTIINYIYFVGIITLIGVSDGIIPIIGYNFGAKRYDRCKSVFKMAVIVNGCIGLVISMVLLLFGPRIIGAFIDSSQQNVIDIATTGASVYAFAFLLNGFNILSASFFTAVTNAKLSIIISALRGIVFVSIAITIIPELFGIEYVWYAVPISEVLTLSISITLIYHLFKKWKCTIQK